MATTNKYIIVRRDQRIEGVVIESEGLTIGRLQGNDLVLNNRAVSPTHAGIKEIDGEYWFFNLSSSHNTALNGKLIDQASITDGDVAEIRPYLLRFEKREDGLRIVVEIEADSIIAGDKVVAVEPAPVSAARLDEQALKVYWEKRKREAGKVAEKPLLSPRGERKIGKAQFNWVPTLDLKQPWRNSYFIWGGIVVTAFSFIAMVGYSQAYSPGPTAAVHGKILPSSSTVAIRANTGSCYECHAVAVSKDDKCAACHQTQHFTPSISEAHRREGIGCSDCHSEHQGRDSASALLKAGLCVDCHNDGYRIKTGEKAGSILGDPHGDTFGYPKVNGVWKWKGLTAEEWRNRNLPEMLALRPASEQFHAVHRTIYKPGASANRMACRDCHAAGIPEKNDLDTLPREACAACHVKSSPSGEAFLAASCLTCHQQHGRSRDLTALVASVSGDFQRLKQQAINRAENDRNFSQSVKSSARENTAAFTSNSLPRNFGGLPWWGWIGLIAALPIAGFVFLAAYTIRSRLPLDEIKPDESKESEAGLSDGSNIESEELVYPHPVINPLLCIGCHACVEACPHDVLDIVGGVAMPVALDQCMEDTSCMVECPTSPKACVVVNTKKVIPPRKVPRRDQSLMTNVPGIYLIGDVSGVPLIKNAINEGARVIDCVVEALQAEPSAAESEYDVAIIGIGPAGLSAAAIAKQRGLKYVAIEQNKIANTIRTFPAGKYVFFKPDTAEAIGLIPLQGVGEIKEEMLQSWFDVVKTSGLEIHEEESCKKIEPNEHGFTVITEKDGGKARMTYQTRKVILAIGNHGSPMRLQVPGEDQKILVQPETGPEFLDDKVKFKLSDPGDYVNRKCIIVGAGNSAIEAAVALTGFMREGDQFTFTRDNEVTLVVRSDFKGDLKLGNKMDVYDCIEAGRIKVFFKTAIKEIREKEVTLMDARSKAETTRLPNDYIFALIGSEKPTKFLESLGIKIG
ncbi:MAG: NAD(P)-binding domain-containing protein [Blastocatellales bacterium]